MVEHAIDVSLVIPPPLKTNIAKTGSHINEAKQENEHRYLQKNGMETDQVAERILAGIERRKYRIVVGTKMVWLDFAARLFPAAVLKRIIKSRSKFDFI